jgi:bifunctional non-homologous end joining protein LigD
MRLPDPMLARGAPLPIGGGHAFEVKWDGFRAIVGRNGNFAVRSRRGWSMTELLPELEALPVHAILDGEITAPDEKGRPSFPRLQRRLIQRDPSVPIRFMAFDVLELDGVSNVGLTWHERRRLLDDLELEGSHWSVPPCFDDGLALWQAVVDQALEGIVAKPKGSRYIPGERGWTKIKNRQYWRFPLEREGAIRSRVRQFL